MAAAHRRLFRRARQIHLRPAGPPRPGHRFHRLRRHHSFRRHGARIRCWAAAVRVHSGALVEDSIIFDNCDIGRRARVRRAILDKNVRVPEDAEIGYDLERDREMYSRHRQRHRGDRGHPHARGCRDHAGLMGWVKSRIVLIDCGSLHLVRSWVPVPAQSECDAARG